jgi:hypothetical protein
MKLNLYIVRKMNRKVKGYSNMNRSLQTMR